jgi:hypothetical protein
LYGMSVKSGRPVERKVGASEAVAVTGDSRGVRDKVNEVIEGRRRPPGDREIRRSRASVSRPTRIFIHSSDEWMKSTPSSPVGQRGVLKT